MCLITKFDNDQSYQARTVLDRGTKFSIKIETTLLFDDIIMVNVISGHTECI